MTQNIYMNKTIRNRIVPPLYFSRKTIKIATVLDKQCLRPITPSGMHRNSAFLQSRMVPRLGMRDQIYFKLYIRSAPLQVFSHDFKCGVITTMGNAWNAHVTGHIRIHNAVLSCVIYLIEYNYFRLSRVRQARPNWEETLRALQKNMQNVQTLWPVRMGKMLPVSYAACCDKSLLANIQHIVICMLMR